jgi:hypothetical protein
MKDDNILIFPQSRCRSSQEISTRSGPIITDCEYHGLQESELFLARLLHNIAEQYQLDPYYASQTISPYIPGLHSLVETVLNYCDSPSYSAEQIDIINQLLARTLVNSFQHAQQLASE